LLATDELLDDVREAVGEDSIGGRWWRLCVDGADAGEVEGTAAAAGLTGPSDEGDKNPPPSADAP
jgi:hypothetical protein